MPGPKPEFIALTSRQRTILQQLVRRQTGPQHLVWRANIILTADASINNEPIAQQLGLNRLTVRTWRNRGAMAAESLAEVEACEDDKALTQRITDLLADLPPSGVPPTFTAEQICQMVALACEQRKESERPISHWTPKELADESVKRGIVATISPRHVGRFLKSVRPEASSFSVLA